MSVRYHSHVSSDLRAKLLESGSVKSLLQERSVAEELRRLRWDVTHGVFYRDGDTGKVRELDAVASRESQFQGSPKDAAISLKLVIECKSMNGFHVVVSNSEALSRHLLESWWVADDRVSLAIFNSVIESGGRDDCVASSASGVHYVTIWAAAS